MKKTKTPKEIFVVEKQDEKSQDEKSHKNIPVCLIQFNLCTPQKKVYITTHFLS